VVKTKKAQDCHPLGDHARASPLILCEAQAWFSFGKQSRASPLHGTIKAQQIEELKRAVCACPLQGVMAAQRAFCFAQRNVNQMKIRSTKFSNKRARILF